jgi:hypothetical protein
VTFEEVGAKGEPEFGHDCRRRQPGAGDVADDEGEVVVVDGNDAVPIAAHLDTTRGCDISGGNGESGDGRVPLRVGDCQGVADVEHLRAGPGVGHARNGSAGALKAAQLTKRADLALGVPVVVVLQLLNIIAVSLWAGQIVSGASLSAGTSSRV